MTKRCTLKEFIEKANIVHKNKYDYSKTKYVDSHTPVIIICPIHKEFIQAPHKHLVGHGCPKCAKNGIKYDENDLIEKFNLVHKNKYDYSNVEYKNSHTKIKIISRILKIYLNLLVNKTMKQMLICIFIQIVLMVSFLPKN